MTKRTSPTIGYSLSSEEHPPGELVDMARSAADRGFLDMVISDHFHPWVGAQGHAPFVWSVLGGIAAAVPDVSLGTAVTCPTMRIHPAILAQAAATVSLMTDRRFFCGVGTGERLNEHVLGDRWPAADERLEMLTEAVEVMRLLFDGEEHSHRGRHYRVEAARLHDAPAEPVPLPMSAYGPKAAEVAARIGDGLVVTSPDVDTIERYRAAGGAGPVIAATKACWAVDVDDAVRTVHHLWPTHGLVGEMTAELRTTVHFEQAAELVDPERAVGSIPVGPDPEVHAAALREFADAGVERIYVHQIGPEQESFLCFYRDEVIPNL